MDSILNFLADNYIWFMCGAGVLLLALIGLIVDGKKHKNKEAANNNVAPTPEINEANMAYTEQGINTVSAATLAPVQEEPSLTFDNVPDESRPTIRETQNEPNLNMEASNVNVPSEPVSMPGQNVNNEVVQPVSMPNDNVMLTEESVVIPEVPVIPEIPEMGESKPIEVEPQVVNTGAPYVENVAAPVAGTPETVSAPSAPVDGVAPVNVQTPETAIPTNDSPLV